MHNHEVRSPTFHQVIRSEIAQTLSRITPTPSALPSFNLIMFNLHFWIQDWSQAYLVPDDAYFDSLYEVIRATTAQCARLGQLSICGVIEGSLLQPGQHAPLPEPYCQNSPVLTADHQVPDPNPAHCWLVETPKLITMTHSKLCSSKP